MFRNSDTFTLERRFIAPAVLVRGGSNQVIPVTPDIGLIEWVQNTRPLKSVIEQGLGCGLHELPARQMFTK